MPLTATFPAKHAGPAETTSAGRPPFAKQRMYAISFDLDIESLRQAYGDPYNHAYRDIRGVLNRLGFKWQQGSVYFGDDTVDAVACVLASQELARELPWFAASVRDIRMLRIEENNDLMPAVEAAR